jgi:hypothetical protein
VFDTYLKLVRQEITSKELVEILPIRVRKYKSYIRSNIRQLAELDPESYKYMEKMMNNILKDVDLLVRTRMIKVLLGSKPSSESIDQRFLQILEGIAEYIKLYLSGLMIEYENNIVVEFKDNMVYRGKSYRRGDIVLMDVFEAFKLYIQGLVEPILNPYIEKIGLENKG